MIDLHLHGWKVNTVFDLLGETENDITFSVGWGLARCEPFLGALLQSVFGENSAGDPRSINLQRHAENGGYTDIEITTSRAYLIVEAKRGWSLPGEDQLRRYTKRFHQNSLKRGLLVLSECTPEFAQDNLPPKIRRIPVHYRSWKQLSSLAHQSARNAPHADKRLLRELCLHRTRGAG